MKMTEAFKASVDEVCDLLGWKCYWEGEDLEVENWSPAGEDLVYTGIGPDPVESLISYARGFDIDEHVEELIEAKHSGLRGVPSASILVRDAEEIDEMLNELAEALEALESVFDDDSCALKSISLSEAHEIIDTRNPAGLFILRDGEIYVGIDNRSGMVWTEQFSFIEDCIAWIYNEDEKGIL